MRPLAAPAGYYEFDVNDLTNAASDRLPTQLQPVFPNPASAIAVVPVHSDKAMNARLELVDLLGKQVDILFEGELSKGESKFFLHAERYRPGIYFLVLKAENGVQTQRIVVD